MTYKEYKDPPKWSKNRLPVNWNGNYTEVYIADFDSYYDGFINKTDIDSFMVKGKFFPIKSVYSQLRKEHKDALNAVYKNQYVTEQRTFSGKKDVCQQDDAEQEHGSQIRLKAKIQALVGIGDQDHYQQKGDADTAKDLKPFVVISANIRHDTGVFFRCRACIKQDPLNLLQY